ncbi:unnamed protein product [Owenia fusiformis]|uniref:Tektin n=1 Tax=Owenia fusiformis TaxID=6347 RepID=A0A8S4Q6F4_OWEFU|nr:unnamed protein product [Owenia fusiformis]
MAKLVQAPPRFTHNEWNISNMSKYRNAEAERIAAERLCDESDRLLDETAKRTDKTQKDVNKKFDQRIDDVNFWKKELDDKLDGIKNETENLMAYKTRVEKAIASCHEPLHIAKQCLINREKRRGIDLVHDDVQKELMKEVETIEGVLALLKRALEQSNEQLRLNRKGKYNLEKDLKDKFSALSIDEDCRELRNNSAGLKFKGDAAKIETNSLTPEDWQDFSNENIVRTEQERMASVNLRSMIDGILQQTCNDMTKQNENTNISFQKRVAESKDSKSKLEDHLSKVIKQIKDMEENISRLTMGLADKEAPLKLSHTRLDDRTNRPNVELCRDPVQYRLIGEVQEIEQSVARLREKLGASEASLKGLDRQKLGLEEDIDVKANTLFIDEVQCMGMRESINIQSF